jgi:hypothetical protein
LVTAETDTTTAATTETWATSEESVVAANGIEEAEKKAARRARVKCPNRALLFSRRWTTTAGSRHTSRPTHGGGTGSLGPGASACAVSETPPTTAVLLGG